MIRVTAPTPAHGPLRCSSRLFTTASSNRGGIHVEEDWVVNAFGGAGICFGWASAQRCSDEPGFDRRDGLRRKGEKDAGFHLGFRGPFLLPGAAPEQPHRSADRADEDFR